MIISVSRPARKAPGGFFFMNNGIEQIGAAALLETIEPPAINPEVIQHATAPALPPAEKPAPEPQPAAPPKKKRGPVDAAGVVYDPELHERRKKKDGTWAKKRGRKPGRKAAASAPDDAPRVVIPEEPEAERDNGREDPAAPDLDPYTIAALQMTGLFFLPGQLIWSATPNEAQQAAAVEAWTAYFREKGIIEPPPWVQLAIVGAAWYGPLVAQSLEKPKNRDRMARAYIRARAFLRGIFRRRRRQEDTE